MATAEVFKKFLNQVVVVVYKDEERTMKGILESIDEERGLLL